MEAALAQRMPTKELISLWGAWAIVVLAAREESFLNSASVC